jgi:hypothetical protein
MEDFGLLYGHLVYLTAIYQGSICVLWPFCIYFMVIWNIFSRFGMLYLEKSGNTGHRSVG